MYQLQPPVKWHEASWAKAMACTKPWIVGVRVEPGYSCIIERLEILGDSGVFFFFLWRNPIFQIWKWKQCYTTEIWKTIFFWALTTIFFLFLFYFSMISKERCGRALGRTWSKGASRRVGLMLRGWRSDVLLPPHPNHFSSHLFVGFWRNSFSSSQGVLRKKNTWIQWFNRSFSLLGYILLVVVDGDKQSPFTIDPWPRWIVCAAALKLLPPDLLEGHLPDKP